jgi:hypothetical protein
MNITQATRQQTKHLSYHFSQTSILAFTKSFQNSQNELSLALIQPKLHFLSQKTSSPTTTNFTFSKDLALHFQFPVQELKGHKPSHDYFHHHFTISKPVFHHHPIAENIGSQFSQKSHFWPFSKNSQQNSK